MPLHMTGMVSRRDLDGTADEPVKIVAPPLERVLKFNPNHGPDGRFTEAPGGRKGGTMGAPTEDAFGRPLRRGRGRSAEAAAFGGGASLPAQRAAEMYRKMRAGEGGLGYTKSSAPPRALGGGFTTRGALSASGGKYRSLEAAAAGELSAPRAVPLPHHPPMGVSGGGGPKPVPMPHHGGTGGSGSKPVPMPNVGGTDVTAPKGQYFDEYGVLQETNPRRSAEAKAFHYKGAFHPGSMDKNGKPTKRSSFS